jgi:hypothetical protein
MVNRHLGLDNCQRYVLEQIYFDMGIRCINWHVHHQLCNTLDFMILVLMLRIMLELFVVGVHGYLTKWSYIMSLDLGFDNHDQINAW